jgi:alpha-glucoside transport system substrate-binding protein
MNQSRIPYAGLILLLLSTIGLTACFDGAASGSVSLLGPWIGTEENQFKNVLRAFTQETGIRVNYQGTRALSQVLGSNVQAGTPPDVAVLSSPGELAKYARNRQLYPLDRVLDDKQRAAFGSQWLLHLDDHVYTVPIKANLKSIIWYNRHQAPEPLPKTWQDLVKFSRSTPRNGAVPWCIGMGDAPNSGWPGSDMIEDILLHTVSPDTTVSPVAYERWAAGKLPWNSGAVKQAWMDWSEISPYRGSGSAGSDVALFTDFGDAGRPMFAAPPRCFLDHQASFIMGFYRDYKDGNGSSPQPGRDFDFFPFPAGSQDANQPWEASADLAGMFNDTPQARELMHFLATDEAQRIWPGIGGSGAFTVDRNVRPDIHYDDPSRRIAGILTSRPLCLDAADIMPATMRNAFYRAVLEYLSGPGNLDSLLDELDAVRRGIPAGDWLDLPCG